MDSLHETNMKIIKETALIKQILRSIKGLPSRNKYRVSHIILDYLQSLTPEYAHYTQKI